MREAIGRSHAWDNRVSSDIGVDVLLALTSVGAVNDHNS